MKRTEINNELEQLDATQLLHIPVVNSFLIDAQFLNSLEKSILQQTFSIEEGFEVPTDYFTALEKDILRQTSGAKNKQTSFSIPSDYFEELEKAILTETKELETPVIASNRFSSRLIIWSSVAALFILGFFLFNPVEKQPCVTFACLLGQSDLSDEDFLEIYDADVADELLETADFDRQSEFEDNDLIEYLIEENIDLDVLTNTIES
ncbi:MAG: hypothetical protein ACJAU0_001704 [Flavobacteriales bacterium]|jgi:hypothetical protein